MSNLRTSFTSNGLIKNKKTMLIEKSKNHESFYCIGGVIYEKIKNRKPLKIRTLNFNYPDKDFLTEEHVSYLNTHYNYHQNRKITNTGDQMELF